jgi:hypothetical protein
MGESGGESFKKAYGASQDRAEEFNETTEELEAEARLKKENKDEKVEGDEKDVDVMLDQQGETATKIETLESNESEKTKEAVINKFKEILSKIGPASNFNLIEFGLENSEKGYSFYREGSSSGFKMADPACLRRNIAELKGVSLELIEDFDDLMCELSETDNIPWEELRKSFKEVKK